MTPDSRRRRGPRARCAVGIAGALAATVVGGGVAFAYWQSVDSSNFAAAAADMLPAGATPSGSVTGSSTIAVSFPRAVTTGGSDVTGYTVNRYSSPTAPNPSATFACSWPSATVLSCSDTGVPPGLWYYTDTPVIARSTWTGAQSPKSPAVKNDTTPPVATVSSVAPAPNGNGYDSTSPVTVNLTATDTGGSGVASVTYWVDGGTRTTVAATTAAVPVTDEGTHSVSYFATDNVGNASATATQPVKIDSTAPNAAAITFPASGRSYTAAGWTGAVTGTASGTPGGSGVASTQVTIQSTSGATSGQYWNGATFAPSPTWLNATGTSTWSYPFARPADGTYAVAARSTDLAGNTGAASRGTSFTIDTLAPTLSIANPLTPSTNTTPTLSGGYGFTTGDIAAVSVQIFNGSTPVGGVLTATLNTTAHTWSKTVPTLAPGTYTARASQNDAAGNTGTATSTPFTVTAMAPNAPVISYPTNGGSYSAASWAGAISGTASETGGSVQKTQLTIKSTSGPTNGQYYNGAGAFASAMTWLTATGTASWSYSVPAQAGTYTVTAWTTDNGGKTGPTTSSNVTITP